MSEKKGATRSLVVVGYELTAYDDAMSLRLTYGKPRSEAGPGDRQTPTLFLMPDEARELARDLVETADKIDRHGNQANGQPLH